MAKTKISEWSATPANNTDIDGINIAEGCAPSGINDAIREMMAQVKDLYSGTTGDATAIAGGGTGATTASAARTNLGVAVGTDVLPVANPSYTGTLTGGTGVVNIGSGQVYKDASGNVGIGTSSFLNSERLQVKGAALGTTAGNTAYNTVFYTPDTSNTTRLSVLDYRVSNGSTHISSINKIQRRVDGTDMGFVGFGSSGSGNNVVSFGNGTTEYAGFDSSGNLGIGTSSPQSLLDVRGNGYFNSLRLNGSNTTDTVFQSTGDLGIAAASASNILLRTNNAERARIDSSGNLLVGTTSNPTSARFVVSGARASYFKSTQTNTAAIQAYNASSNNDEPTILGGNDSSASSGVVSFYSSLGSGNGAQNNTNCYHLKAVTQGVGINYLYGNGTTSFTSDARLKKNITSTRDGYAEDLCKLRVVKYNWNTAPEGEAQELGLIAQEVEQVFPGLVQDADTEIQGFTPKVLKGSVLPFMLLKAIQEQQAIITQLQADVAALKGQA